MDLGEAGMGVPYSKYPGAGAVYTFGLMAWLGLLSLSQS